MWLTMRIPAENYYTADYPDDEVASDDEYGVDPYQFSRDLDEFEADEVEPNDDLTDEGPGRGFRITIGGKETERNPFVQGP